MIHFWFTIFTILLYFRLFCCILYCISISYSLLSNIMYTFKKKKHFSLHLIHFLVYYFYDTCLYYRSILLCPLLYEFWLQLKVIQYTYNLHTLHLIAYSCVNLRSNTVIPCNKIKNLVVLISKFSYLYLITSNKKIAKKIHN